MTAIFVAWAISAAALVLIAVLLSTYMSPPRVPFGILIDGRGRYSLTHFQLVVWSIVVLSLLSGVFWGRLVHGVDNPLDFAIPDQLLGLLGISAGSAVTAGVVKAGKDASAGSRKRVAASTEGDPPRFAQLFLLEEGAYADRVVDVTKFQNFVITITLVVAYVALSIHTIADARAVTSLPTFSGTMLVLLGISHAAYITGKIPNQAGEAPGVNMGNRRAVGQLSAQELIDRGVTPRNLQR